MSHYAEAFQTIVKLVSNRRQFRWLMRIASDAEGLDHYSMTQIKNEFSFVLERPIGDGEFSLLFQALRQIYE